MGDPGGCDQCHGGIDRHRPSLRRHRRPIGHDAVQRNGPSRRSVWTDLRVRAGWDGLRDGPGAAVSEPAFRVTIAEGIARVVFDLPGEPINKITRGVREELDALLTRMAGDGSVRAVVLLSGKPDTFIAGADIDEFVALSTAPAAESLVRDGQKLVNRLGEIGKPVVAAIHGACLGGGLESALACMYRVATEHPKTTLGLPEVQLGIIPAAGGCQRLPRLIGLRAALDIILAGKTVPSSRAFRLGIVDELVHPAILDQVAEAAARRLATGWRPARRAG